MTTTIVRLGVTVTTLVAGDGEGEGETGVLPAVGMFEEGKVASEREDKTDESGPST